MYQHVFKRIFDILFSFFALIILALPMLILAFLIKLDSPGPIFFRQKRIGRNGTFFKIIKFRTMFVDTPSEMPTHQLSNPNSHISKMGSFLRRTSLDELPQLFNILSGSMSLIGPRPALWNQDDLFAEREKYGANALRPGLTGYAQINGRDEVPIPVKAKMDGFYAENIGFWLDTKIFFGTFLKVFRASGLKEGGPKPPSDTV